MARFTLLGVDGNAFAVMGYTARCMKKAGLGAEVDKMYGEAKSGDYYNLIAVCDGYVEKANEALGLGSFLKNFSKILKIMLYFLR